MRKFLIVLIVTCFTPVFALGQDTVSHEDYKRFHTGTFEYLTGAYRGTNIKRTRHKQYEYDPAVHRKAILGVKWVSNNEYWLTLIKDNNAANKQYVGMVIKVKITSATKDTYTCHWTCDNCGRGGDDSFKKVK